MSKIIGIGNALVDVLIRLENDQVLQDFALPKGSMQLVDTDFVNKLTAAIKNIPSSLASGGSAANTIIGLANMGVQTGFIGSIGKDDLGKAFLADLNKKQVEPKLFYSEQETGRANTLISADGERTFATYLGAATELSGDGLTEEHLVGYDYLHIEGYLVFNHDLLIKVGQLAEKLGLTVSIDLASYNVVEANLDFLKEYVERYVHILFANEEEAKSFTGLEPKEALHAIAEMVDIAVVKVGANGSYIQKGDEVIQVPIIKVNCIDTTGAGDLYAAGFLFGFVNDFELDDCGRIGAIMAGNVIEEIGAKMTEERWTAIKAAIHEIS